MKKYFILLIAMVCVYFSSNAAIVQVDSLNDSGYGSLRAAVDSAQSGDTIRFNPSLIGSGSDSIKLATMIVLTKNLTIIGQYNATDTLYISGNKTSRIFEVDNSMSVVIDSLVMVDGEVTGRGGAVFCDANTSLEVYNSFFVNNTTYGDGYGGAIYSPSDLLIENCLFLNNMSSRSGGAVHVSGYANDIDLKITLSTFKNNWSSTGGGAIYLYNSTYHMTGSNPIRQLDLTDCEFENNSTFDHGGAIWIQESLESYITRVLFKNNSANFDGGAIYSRSQIKLNLDSCIFENNTARNAGAVWASNLNEIDISNSEFTNNHANASNGISYNPIANTANGGAVYFSSPRNTLNGHTTIARITNSTFSENNSDKYGGAIYGNWDNYPVYFDKCTITKNSSLYGGSGVFIGASHPSISVWLKNSTIWSNLGAPIGVASFSSYSFSNCIVGPNEFSIGSFVSQGNNIFCDSINFIPETTDILDVDSLALNLDTLKNNGGFTRTLMPLYPSVALEAGTPLNDTNAQNGMIHGVREIGSTESCVSIYKDIKVVCDSLVWLDGNTYSERNDTSVLITTNAFGCDSIIELDLTIESDTIIDKVAVNDTLVWLDGNTYYESNNTATYIETLSSGCSRVVQLDLTVEFSNQPTELFGVTQKGGANNHGALFRYNLDDNTYEKLVDFNNTVSGAYPVGTLLMASNGLFYGVTTQGGANSFGSIFSYDPITNTHTKLFDFSNTTGRKPKCSLIEVGNGKLYGTTTSYSGATSSNGTIFEYDINTNVFTTKYSFPNTWLGASYGKNPIGSLLLASDGYLYGMAELGGSNDEGVIYRYDTSTSVVTAVHDFTGASNGANPTGSLIEYRPGVLRGMTKKGGSNDDGVNFQFYTSNFNFSKSDFVVGINGEHPTGNLVPTSYPWYWGMTSEGGVNDDGIIFNSAGYTISKFFEFNNATGKNPSGSLILGSNKKLYGLTDLGGAFNKGTLFEYDSTFNRLTTLVDFDGVNGGLPFYNTLVQTNVCYNSYSTRELTTCHFYETSNGDRYKTPGSYDVFDTIPNYCGADSIITIHLTILPYTEIIDTITTCKSYTWRNGVTYTSSNYTDTLTSYTASGCDTLFSLFLTFDTLEVTDTINVCHSYTWRNGITYSANNYTDTFRVYDSTGCDTLFNLHLTFNVEASFDTLVTCDSLTWINGVTYHTDNFSDSMIFTNVWGCDSVVYLNLDVLEKNTTDTVESCFPIYWVDGVYYDSSNYSAIDTLTNSLGCDSIVNLHFTRGYRFTRSDTVVSECNYTWINGQTYFSSATANYTIPNPNGCDTIASLNFTKLPNPIKYDTISACEEFRWINGVTYYFNPWVSAPTVYDVSTLSRVGACDTIINLHLEIYNSNQYNVTIDTVNAVDSYTWINGETYYFSTNTPRDTLVDSHGCDSIINLNLNLTASIPTPIVVNTNDRGIGSLRRAIFEAADGGTILFDPKLIANGSDSIVLNSSIEFSKSLTFKGLYNSFDTLFISGGGLYRIFNVPSASVLRLDSMVFVNGLDSNNGGAINFDFLDSLLINDSFFKNNYSGSAGGAIHINQIGKVRIHGSVFESNYAGSAGSAFYLWRVNLLELDGCLIKNNRGTGGTIRYNKVTSPQSIIFNNSKFLSNVGGGIKGVGNYHNSTSISHCVFVKNTLYAVSLSALVDNTVRVTYSTFEGNDYGLSSSSNAGFSKVSVEQSTFAENNGWAIGSKTHSSQTYSYKYSEINVKNSTIVNNTAPNGGACNSSHLYNGGSRINITGSLVYNNGANEFYNSANPKITSGGYNIFSKPTRMNTLPSDFYNVDSLSVNLGSLTDIGNDMRVVAPLLTSIAINNGNPLDSVDAQNGPIVGVRDIGASEKCREIIIDTVYSCTPFTWRDSITYTANTDSAIFMGLNPMGCDTLYRLIFSTGPTFAVDTRQACDSLTWINGITYYSNNTSAKDTLLNHQGCDSVVTLNLRILKDVVIDRITACDSYTWIDGNTYTSSNNSAFDTLTNSLGCDSIISLDLTINSSFATNDTIQACDNYTWVNGITYYSDTVGVYDTLTTVNGCDSVVQLVLDVNQTTYFTDTHLVCDSLTWIDGNVYYTNNSTATYSLTNVGGCDSVVTLDLTVRSSSFEYDTLTACDSLTWRNGVTYYANNYAAIDTLLNLAGCDSIIGLHLTILNSSSIDSIVACDSITWMDGITYTSSNQSATHTLINSNGCDSTIYLNLTILNTTFAVDTLVSCDSLTWINGVTYYSNTIGVLDTLVNSVGCDSIVSLNLTINSASVYTDTIVACDSYTWINGVTYYSSITGVTDTLVNSVGCDSIIVLDLTIHSTMNYIDSYTVCDSLTWINGVTYYSSNYSAQDTLQTINGCDSIVTLDLTVHNSNSIIDTVDACDSFTWVNGVTYTSSVFGVIDTLTNVYGCDSIVTLNVSITSIDSNTTVSGDTIWANQTTATYQWYDCQTNQPINGETNRSFVPLATGDYKVEVTLNNCMKFSSCVTMNICNNQAAYSYSDLGSGAYAFTNLSSGNITQYDWSFGDGVTDSSMSVNHTYQANGNYVVVLATNDSLANTGCVDYYYDTISVTSVPNSVACQAGFSIYYDSTSNSLSVVNSSTGSHLTYSWDFGDGNSSSQQFPTHAYATNGPFNLCLTVSDGNGCTDTFCDSVTSQGVVFRSGFTINIISPEPTGIDALKLVMGKVTVFPNPTSDVLWVETSDWSNSDLEYVLLDVNGKVIKTKTVTNNATDAVSFNVKDLSKGVYFIRVIGEKEISTTQVVVQ